MISKFTKLAIGAVATGGLLLSQAALAGLLTVNLGGFICPDNAACDSNPLVNVITVQAGVNGVPLIPGYTVAITIGTSNNPGGPLFSKKASSSASEKSGEFINLRARLRSLSEPDNSRIRAYRWSKETCFASITTLGRARICGENALRRRRLRK